MLPAIHRNYQPKSREHHYNLMEAFIASSRGLAPSKYEYEHILCDGVYIRKLKLKANALLVGAVHKRETTMIILKGSIQVFAEDGLVTLKAGDIKVSIPGTQRAGYALEDTTLITLHRADSNNLEEVVSSFGEGDINTLSGVREGHYKLYEKGKKVRDEKIQSTCKDAIEHRYIQRVLFD